MLKNPVGGKGERGGGEVGLAAGSLGEAFAREDENAARQTGASGEFNVGGLVADDVGTGEVKGKVAGGIENHAGSGFAVVGGDVRSVGAEVGGVQEIGAELAEKFGVNGLVVRPGEVAAPDAALIGDHHQPETGGAQTGERRGSVGVDDDL